MSETLTIVTAIQLPAGVSASDIKPDVLAALAFVAAYQQGYSCEHLISVIEDTLQPLYTIQTKH
jgi:hypothetical protein